MKFDELWIIRGNKPVLWTMPFWLVWDTEEVEATIYCSLVLPSFMTDPVTELLATCARPYNGMWRILKEDLERIAYKVDPPVNAPFYFSWERTKEYQKPVYRPEDVAELNDSIDAMYQRGVGNSREEVAYWWRQISNHFFDWIIMKEKPVDLGFIKLHPTHYRQNWKSVLLGRFPKLGLATNKFTKPELDYIMHATGFTEMLLSLDLLAMNPTKHYLYRSVEVELTKTWYKAVYDVEMARKKRLGVFIYASRCMDSVKRSLPAMQRIYRQWLAHIARPTAKDIPGRRFGSMRMVPYQGDARRSDFVSTGVLHPVVPNKMPSFKPASLPNSVFAPAENLPKLPNLQPDGTLLRKHRGDVPIADDWQI